MPKEVEKPAEPLKYGDKVFHAYPGISKHAQVVNIHEFEAEIREYMVLFEFLDQVVVTSERFVKESVAKYADYWKERDQDGCYKNFNTHRLIDSATTVLWREHLHSTREEALTYQKEALELAKKSLQNYEERLNKLFLSTT